MKRIQCYAFIVLTAFTLSCFSGQARAESSGQFYMLGGWKFSSEDTKPNSGSIHVGANIDYILPPKTRTNLFVGLEGEAGHLFDSATVNGYETDFGLDYAFFLRAGVKTQGNPLTIYAKAGYGQTHIKRTSATERISQFDGGLRGGGGAEYRVPNFHLSLRADYTYIFYNEREGKTHLFRVGVSFPF
ncbi:MAG: outer membrane beta-barrel protein [Alphaproteobacteria bacterium GM7ARS4]|nr:outer membrane beta-barrel protein [Alphaproteobacteria bacterium GM7ARS4]